MNPRVFSEPWEYIDGNIRNNSDWFDVPDGKSELPTYEEEVEQQQNLKVTNNLHSGIGASKLQGMLK